MPGRCESPAHGSTARAGVPTVLRAGCDQPWPTATVGWALDFALGYFGGPAERRREVIERLGLSSLLSSAIGTLSKGERKRAVLAVGMLTPQPILLVDEPFDGLDFRQCREVGAALRAHAADGRTLFLRSIR
jgi:ABC-2 type transport system ATP-binding protein